MTGHTTLQWQARLALAALAVAISAATLESVAGTMTIAGPYAFAQATRATQPQVESGMARLGTDGIGVVGSAHATRRG